MHKVFIDYTPVKWLLDELKAKHPEFSEEDGYNLFESLAWSYFDENSDGTHQNAYRYMTNNGFPETAEEWRASERALDLIEEIDRVTLSHLPSMVTASDLRTPVHRYPGVSVESVSPDYVAILTMDHATYLKMLEKTNDRRKHHSV